ncbi:hypothetical protein ACEZCY_15380 [Streptacidiphilus sp. N1-12]|uniref:Uncharacterized protein n=2 Tax=Streptacidiphilus alkalitolerans TaxID=3342712 RepID=A0ABV6WEX9_9ACTN
MQSTITSVALPQAAGPIAHFLTLGGALVALVQSFDPDAHLYSVRANPKHAPAGGWPVYTWHCQGCWAARSGDTPSPDLAAMRTAANDHAGTCRAVPQPDHR